MSSRNEQIFKCAAVSFLSACVLIGCTADAASTAERYPENLPGWLSEGLELCRSHMLGEDNLSAKGAAKMGWGLLPSNDNSREVSDLFSDLYTQTTYFKDGPRYRYFLSPVTRTYGLQTRKLCSVSQMQEPWKDDLPEAAFTAISDIAGVTGDFIKGKPCESCPDALIGQWSWAVGSEDLYVMGTTGPNNSVMFSIQP